MAATAQANAEATKEAQQSGIEHARMDDSETKYRGRKPSLTSQQLTATCNMLDLSVGVSEIAANTGLSREATYRISGNRAAAEAALANWRIR